VGVGTTNGLGGHPSLCLETNERLEIGWSWMEFLSLDAYALEMPLAILPIYTMFDLITKYQAKTLSKCKWKIAHSSYIQSHQVTRFEPGHTALHGLTIRMPRPRTNHKMRNGNCKDTCMSNHALSLNPSISYITFTVKL